MSRSKNPLRKVRSASPLPAKRPVVREMQERQIRSARNRRGVRASSQVARLNAEMSNALELQTKADCRLRKGIRLSKFLDDWEQMYGELTETELAQASKELAQKSKVAGVKYIFR